MPRWSLLIHTRLIFASLMFLVSSQVMATQKEITATPDKDTIIIGVISSNPTKVFKRTQAFADYVASQLEHRGITSSRIAIAKDIDQMARWLKNGQVDIVSETTFAAHELNQSANAKFLARRWKSGEAEYSTVFFTSNESGIKHFDDLVGKVIAFEDRGSTSAFLIPASILLKRGYELYEVTSPRETPPKNKIGYFFSDEFSSAGGEANMMSWVYGNFVASAAFSNLDWQKEVPSQVKNKLNIYYQSQAIPRAITLVRADLPQELQTDIKEILLSAHQDEQGKRALDKYKDTKKFDSISPSIIQSIEWAGELKELIDSHLTH